MGNNRKGRAMRILLITLIYLAISFCFCSSSMSDHMEGQRDDLTSERGGQRPEFSIHYHPIKGETGEIRGMVWDNQMTQPIPGATIQISRHKMGTNTDSNGIFVIDDIPDGPVTLWVSSLGYLTAKIPDLQIESKTLIVLIVKLAPSIVPIEKEVVVKGTRPEIGQLAGHQPRFRSRHFCHFSRRSPSITIGKEPGMPLVNVIPVSEIGVIMEDYHPEGWTSISHLIRMIKSSDFSDLTRMSLSFGPTRRGWKNTINQIVDASLPIIDIIDWRRHVYESNHKEPQESPQVIKK